MIGKTISHYKILEKLGEGGMGVVYKAFDTKLEREVALKVLRPETIGDPAAKERFIREARAASALNHPNITTIHEVDEWHGQDFICMEYVDGETVKQKIQSGPMSLDEILNIATQTAEALQEAHEHDIIHRDIKSENIIVTPKGQVKVMDFGLAKLKGVGGFTKNGTTMGTISYMSPEQARGEDVDHRTDIWSFGVVLYEMITRQLPFKGEYEQAVIYSILNEAPKPTTELKSGVPLELERITNRALAKNADERYQSADEIIVDLKQLIHDSTSTAMPKIIRSGPKKSPKSRFIKFAFPGIVLFGLVLAFFILRPLLLKDVIKSEPKPVAVLPFENLTGDSTYNILQRSISNLLIAKLEQSKHLRVTTWERMRDLLKQTGKGKMEIVDMDQETSFALCRMDGVNAAVTGSFSKIGQMFAIELTILDVTSKRILLSETSEGRGENSIFKQIDELTRTIAKGFGLRQRKAEPITKAIEELTTHSMEAYNYFIIGRENNEKFYYQDALQFFEKALQVDSTFAIAYLWLGETLGSLAKDEARNIAFKKAKSYSDNVSEKEKLYIEAFYAEYLENDLDKKLDILKQLIAEFPRDKWSHQLLAGHYDGMKLLDKAIEEYKKVLELDPNHGFSINELAYIYLELGNFDKAIEYLERYKSLNPGDANPYDSMGEIYFRLGKFEEAIANYKMAVDIKPNFNSYWKIAYLSALNENFFEAIKWIDRYMSSSKTQITLITGHLYKGFQYAWLGKIDMSFIELNKSLEFSKEDSWYKSFVQYIKGHVYFDSGEYDNSATCFQEWYRLALFSRFKQNFPVFKIINFYDLGMVDLQLGRIDSAKQKLSLAQAMLPEIIEEKKAWATRIVTYFQGEVLLADGFVEDAIAAFKNFMRTSPDNFSVSPVLYINTPFITDGLARAYQYKGDITKAIAEYEQLIGPELINVHSLIHPKLHYRLAKLYQEKGEKEKAVSEYEKFLDLWKEADQNLPELIDAKKRVANLKKGE